MREPPAVRPDPEPINNVLDLRGAMHEIATAYIMGRIGPGLMQHRLANAIKALPTNQASILADWIVYATEQHR